MLRLTILHLAAGLLWLAAGACGSGARTGPEPELALASSAEAQAQFRALREQWVSAPLDSRAALQPGLTTFVQRYPTDPQGRWARIYLAWIALQRGELELSERWLALAEPGPAGAARDLLLVVRASLELARGNAEQAYGQLLELQGRLIDADDRLVCLDQLVLAAQASGHHREAVFHILELAAQAARRHRERIWRTLEPRLAKIPPTVLEASLRSLSSRTIQSAAVRPAERAAAVDWMRRQILDLLSRSAINARDVELAQRLVAAPSSADGEADTSELLLLATQGGMSPTIVGRTVGLALQLGDATLTQRSIDVAAGLTSTLELASGANGNGEIVLQTRREENGAVGDALARLAGDGASLLLAGLDPRGARLAAEFAAEHNIPVLLLHRPEGDKAPLPASAYLLGADSGAANRVLYRALEGRTGEVVSVGSKASPCPDGDAGASSLPPIAGLGGVGVALSFEGSAQCTREVLMRLMAGAERPVTVGLGLDALGLLNGELEVGELWAVGAGRVPTFEGVREAPLARWYARKGRGPTWYEALGHDAARFAQASLGPAPSGTIVDPAAIGAAHRAVSLAIARAAPPDLWTTNADQFGSDRQLPREFRAVRIHADPSGSR